MHETAWKQLLYPSPPHFCPAAPPPPFKTVGLICWSTISWLFAVCAVVDIVGGEVLPAEKSTIVSAFHHLWGHVGGSTFVKQPIGTARL